MPNTANKQIKNIPYDQTKIFRYYFVKTSHTQTTGYFKNKKTFKTEKFWLKLKATSKTIAVSESDEQYLNYNNSEIH